MHTIAEIGTNVPAFLGKLWKMVEDPVTNDLIAWSSTGTCFVIKDEIRFARELLPMYYKHNNMASFIRQLNMYGFHKMVSPEAGSMKLETPDEIKFTHPYFMRGHPYLLDNIKRKIGVSKVLPGQLGEKTPQVINKVLSDVRQVKGRQETLDSKLTAMKLENGALWRELSVLRQKHMKQQQIVNKLIQFLVTIVQQNHTSFSVKRKYPRMLQHHNKSSNHEITHPEDDMPLQNDHSESSNSPTGPVIHELDPAEALLETVVEEADVDTSSANVADYFLNSSENKKMEELVVNSDIQEPVQIYHCDSDTETIIGMPEDTLMDNSLNNYHKKNGSATGTARTLPPLYEPKTKTKREPEVVRPKYIRVVTKKPRKNGVTHAKVKQMVLSEPQKQIEKTIQQQLRINQNQLEINKQQLIKSEQERLQCQQQSQVQKTQQLPLPRNCHAVLKQKPKQMLRKVSAQQQVQRNAEQLPKIQLQQNMLLQTEQSPPSTSEPIITIPFDNRTSETIIEDVNRADLEPIYIDGATEDFSLPVIVEIPPLPAVSPVQQSTSPAAVSPQDLLLGSSPMLINDPVMTPQVESSPVVTSPAEQYNGEMQVACVEDTVASSPNIVTRSGHQHLFNNPPTEYSRSEMDNHIDAVQNDLDSLKELLRSEGISLDANTLLGYFNDDPLSYNMPDPINNEEPKESNGNELMACNTSLFDFTDLIGNDWSLPASPGENLVTNDSFAEVNTPQFVPQSPTYPTPSKKRKK